jgi:N-methylhydantoinase B/oxoprolinase/acetone carboxylase alpha subunit
MKKQVSAGHWRPVLAKIKKASGLAPEAPAEVGGPNSTLGNHKCRGKRLFFQKVCVFG